MNLLLKNCTLVTAPFDAEQKYDILLKDGMIAEIGSIAPAEGMRVLDVGGKTVLPGLIDMHCNICDPGYEYMEDIVSASRSAARGGFTSITCEPNTNPVIDNKTVVEYVVSKSKEMAQVNIYPYGSMSIGCKGVEMAELGEMHDAGIVAVSDGDEFIDDASFLRNVLQYSRMLHLSVITHCEDRTLSANGVMNEGVTSSKLGLFGMPKEAEEVIVARNIILAEAVGARLHIAHVSTKGSVQLIREAKQRGARITCETCPHYFMLTEAAAEGYNTLAKVNPPLRTQEDVDAILQGIADGTIDVIASGHSPTGQLNKAREFDDAGYGVSSLETAFALSYTGLVETGLISAKRLVDLMSAKPAQILNLHHKGVLEEGRDADLIVVDTDEFYQIEPDHFASKAKFSPFAGFSVKGRVLYTIVGGKVVM